MIAGIWAWWLLQHPIIVGVVSSVFAIGVYVDNRNLHKHFQQLALNRTGESIGSFARATPREVDTWIIRAVYEQVQEYLHLGKLHVPIRWEDDFARDLKMVDDDLEDLVDEVARRTGHSLNGREGNPCYGKVRQVGDLVMYFHQQSQIEGTRQADSAKPGA
jgi:hypothetical protein